MKIFKSFCIVLAITTGSLNSALASDLQKPSEALSILSAWELALLSDSRWQSENARLAAQREIVPQAKAALLPSVSTSANLTQKDQKSTLNSVIDSVSYDGSYSSYALEVRQQLLNRPALKQYSSAKKTTKIVEYNFALARQSLALRLADAYFGLLLANESKTLAESELKAIERQLDQTKQRFKVGLVSNTDVLEARAAYDQVRVTVALAENTQAIQQENLGIIVGRPVDKIINLKSEIAFTEIPVALDTWVDQVLSKSLEFKIAQVNMDIAALSRDAARSGYWPTIDAVASYASVSEDGDTDIFQYGVQANWKPFQGGGLRSRVREAESQYQSATTDVAGLRQTLTRDARNAYKTLATDVVSIKAQFQATLSSESALEATKAGYEVGTRNVVDILNAQRTVFRAKRDLAQARYNWILDRLNAAYLDSSLSVMHLEEIEGWLAK